MDSLSNAFSGLEIDVDDNHPPSPSKVPGKSKSNGNGSTELKSASLSEKYKFPLESLEGPDLVIHQSKECLDRMGEWCQNHHAASGLTKKVLRSTISEREAEKQVNKDIINWHHLIFFFSVIEFVKTNIGTYTPHLAGNSVYMDFIFLKKYMPDLASLFSHVVVDVSSVRALCIRWYPRDQKKAPAKEKKHRAMDDIRESILELKYFKETIFKAKSKK
ncbi:hypothetical protein V6N12_009199 [Hibiscus sabdariffa]|uniref:Exonuclease domain-containing protein n=1 Tax=Hibiscus sabdariffa TaxID=183260 RepID=A0ABR2C5N6_9ROSI